MDIRSKKEELVRQAEQQMADYPQYNGRYRQSGWFLVKIKRKVKTKMGVPFEKGDIAIAQKGGKDMPFELQNLVFAYSWRTRCDTLIKSGDYEALELT